MVFELKVFNIAKQNINIKQRDRRLRMSGKYVRISQRPHRKA